MTGLGKSQTRAYKAWNNMRYRCTSDRWASFYRSRGIEVCERWQKFENFHADMGDPPEGLSLDRIDNDRGYDPDNCRWATWVQQMANRRPHPWSLLTHCIAGHAWDDANTMKSHHGYRRCRACERRRGAAYKARKRAEK